MALGNLDNVLLHFQCLGVYCFFLSQQLHEQLVAVKKKCGTIITGWESLLHFSFMAIHYSPFCVFLLQS